MKNLVIVESPAKAKTIEKFLGKDYTVKSSYGHIRDLPSKSMSIDIENNFEPNYVVSDDKKKVVSELKKAAKTAETVWLATDEDREGEAIAWHLKMALDLKDDKIKRIVFHEITKPAITSAVQNPRTIDQNLVDAQQARRILDRIVGYELSPVLWKKVQAGLSAGRVQSAAVRLIVEREREIEGFETTSSFRFIASFDLGEGKVLKAELPKKLKTIEEAQAFLEDLITAEFKVEGLETKPAKKSPAAPFTTSTLQQEASRKLGFGVKQTMMVAQKLYESGKITYMRTDSVNLSDLALGQAGNVIEQDFGKEYVKIRKYKTKSSGAQEAHEAIRPTDLSVTSAGADDRAKKLYDLIRKRTLASQMADAQIERTTATLSISTRKETLNAKGEVIKFDGFLALYIEGTDDENEEQSTMLPPIQEGQVLDFSEGVMKESFTRPPARYTEASLVKKMEELGIGRPSTYAPTISTVQNRGYVEKPIREGKPRDVRILTLKNKKIDQKKKEEITGAEKNKLAPTETGKIVTDFLVKFFDNVVDYQFTAKVEEQFDTVAVGKSKWQKMLDTFYKGFHPKVEASADISREEASQSRELGIDPKTKKPIIARLGRFGPMVQLGTKDDEEKPKFASLPEGKTLDTVTLEDALPLFELPRKIGKTKDGEEIAANFGRFGPYIKFGSLYVSIKPDDPFSITLERALELIEEKKKAEAEKYIQTWEDSTIQVLNGRYGPYITDTKIKKNAKIPKDKDPKKLTLEEATKILKEAPDKKKRPRK